MYVFIYINIKVCKEELCKNIKHMCGRRHNKKIKFAFMPAHDCISWGSPKHNTK